MLQTRTETKMRWYLNSIQVNRVSNIPAADLISWTFHEKYDLSC